MRNYFSITVALVLALVAGSLFAGGIPARYPAPPEKASPSKTRSKDEKRKIDLKWDEAGPLHPGDSAIFLVGNFAAQHNGAVITCDSAVRYSDRHFEFFGNVLINQNTTYIYGDRAEYDGNENEARIYSDLIKVVDGDATLYTYEFTYNTLDNIGEFSGGGILTNRDNRLESNRGYYYGDRKELIAVDQVEMRNEDYELRGDSVVYNMATDNAYFFDRTNIWSHKGDYLYADRGEYQKNDSLYIITRNGYVLTEKQEMWSDTINYFSKDEHIVLRHDIQIDDSEHKALAFGDYGEYWKHPGNILLTRRPSAISYDLKQTSDTVFMSADTIFLQTICYAEERARAKADSLAAIAREEQRRADSVASKMGQKSGDLKDKAAKINSTTDKQAPFRTGDMADMTADTSTAKSDSIQSDPHRTADSTAVMPADSTADSLKQDSLRSDSLAADTLTAKEKKAQMKAKLKAELEKKRAERRHLKDSLRRQKLDTLIARRKAKNKILLDKEREREERILEKRRKRVAEKLRKRKERAERKGRTFRLIDPALLAQMDSLRTLYEKDLSDSLIRRLSDSILKEGEFAPAVQDSLQDTLKEDSLYRLMKAYRNVKIFRRDFQAVCDSTITSSVDSIIHFYIRPVLWNGQNQITSEVIDVYTRNQKLERAEFTGSPFSASQLDTVHYNQIKGKTMTSYFRDNEVYRNDVNGNVQTIYFMQDGEPPVVTGMAFIESGDASFHIEDKQVVRIVYRTNPTFPIYPIEQVPETQSLYLDGFKWEADRRPTRDSIFNRTLRRSLRDRKQREPHPSFPIKERVERDKVRFNELFNWIDRNDHVDPLTEEWMRELGYEVGQPRKTEPKF